MQTRPRPSLLGFLTLLDLFPLFGEHVPSLCDLQERSPGGLIHGALRECAAYSSLPAVFFGSLHDIPNLYAHKAADPVRNGEPAAYRAFSRGAKERPIAGPCAWWANLQGLR